MTHAALLSLLSPLLPSPCDPLKPTASPASSADMAPISSGSSTWTSSGIPFSFVSMATGMGPSSSGSQATVASVVTSTLLAGLGFSGGGIPSFPSTVWPTRLPTAASASKQAVRPVLATTEALASPGPDGDSAPSKDSEGTEEGEKDEKSESEDGEREHEDEGEKDPEKKKSGVTHAAQEPRQDEPTPTPSSANRTAEEGGHQTLPGPRQDRTAVPTDQPDDVRDARPGLDSGSVTSTQVPPTVTEEHFQGSDSRRPQMPSKKPMSRGDRFSEDSKFITVNPGKWPGPHLRMGWETKLQKVLSLPEIVYVPGVRDVCVCIYLSVCIFYYNKNNFLSHCGWNKSCCDICSLNKSTYCRITLRI